MNIGNWSDDQHPFIFKDGNIITRSDFSRDVNRVCGLLAKIVAPAIVIKLEDDYSSLLAIIACYYSDKVAVPINPKFSGAEKAGLLSNLDRPSHLLSSLNIHQLPEWTCNRNYEVSSDRPWLVIFTSGSSGHPKGVVHSFHTLRQAAASSIAYYGMRAGDVSLLSLGLHHIGGLMIALRAGWSGGVIQMGDPRMIFSAEVTRTIDYVSLVPAQLQQLLEAPENLPGLKRCKGILVGGASCSPYLLDQAFGRGLNLSICYGSSETGAQVLASKPGYRLADPHWVGVAMPWRQISLDQSQLVVSGWGCFLGYMDQGSFELSCGTYRSPDYFFPLENGYVFQGRRDLVFQCGGENISPSDMESRFQQFSWLANYKVLPRRDARFGEVPILIVSMQTPFNIDTFLAYIEKNFSPISRPREIYWDQAGSCSQKLSQRAIMALIQKGELKLLWRYRKDLSS